MPTRLTLVAVALGAPAYSRSVRSPAAAGSSRLRRSIRPLATTRVIVALSQCRITLSDHASLRNSRLSRSYGARPQ